MKKILLLFLLMITVTACSDSNFTSLKYVELSQKLENEETFILLVNDGSEEAELLKKTLDEVLVDNNLKAFEINPNKIKESEKNALRTTMSYENASIIFIKEGIDPSKLSHITNELTDKEEMTQHLTNLGFIKTSNE